MKKLLLIICCYLTFGSIKAQSIITTIAGNGTQGYNGDNIIAINAELAIPNGITFDVSGNLYIADAARIRKVNTLSIITTVAGDGTMGYGGDNGQATAAELAPTGVLFDTYNNLFIADFGNNVIRKVNTITGIITTIAGTGTLGYSGNGGQASSAQLSSPRYLAFDTARSLYFSDEGNNIIQKINMATGIISTIVGIGTHGYSGDGGQATTAQLYYPSELCFDKQNNLYVADAGNNVVRKVVLSTGIITTIAGTGILGYSGDGGQATAAELYSPNGLTLDTNGNLFIADGNNVIRKVNKVTGIIITIAGTGVGGYSGDGGSPLSAELFAPAGLAFDTHDNLYIADNGNQRVRKISNVSSITGVQQYAGSSGQVSIYPNPASSMVQVAYTGSIINISLCDMLGKEVPIPNPFQRKGNSMNIDVSGLSEGVYFVSVKTNEGITTKKVVVQH